jgi:choline-glycine betaine transporter
VLLLAGGLGALQQAAIIAAAPFLLVMIGLCVSLWKALHAEHRRLEPEEPRPAPEPAAPAMPTAGVP